MATKEAENEKNDFKIIPLTDAEMCDADIPEPKWFFPNIMPKPGMVFIAGRPGTGKTTWAMWMARRIASGLPLFNVCESPMQFGLGESHVPAKVLFIEEEMAHIHLKERGNQMFRYDESDKNLVWMINSGMKLKNPDHMKKLAEFVSTNGIEIVFMDPFSSVAGMEDENSNGEASALMDKVRDMFVDELGCAIVFIHHPAKDDVHGVSVRGAGDITGKCDLGMKLESISEDCVRLKISYLKKRIVPQNSKNFVVEMREGLKSEFVYLANEKEWDEMLKANNDWTPKVKAEIERQKMLNGKFSGRSIETALGVPHGHAGVKSAIAEWKAKNNDLSKEIDS